MEARSPQFPLPPFFDESNSRFSSYRGQPAEVLEREAAQWVRNQKIHQGAGLPRVHLLIIDAQLDFSFPDGALYVAGRSGTGGMDANLNLARFIYRNLDVVSEISCTLDTHDALQIFFPAAHLTGAGEHPAPHTVISAADYEQGRYRPSPILARRLGVDLDWLSKQFTYYCGQLEASRKHQLYLWPYHCLRGTEGHRIAGIIDEAVSFHGLVHGRPNRMETKGTNPLSESYSALQEEVTTTWDGGTLPGLEEHKELLDCLRKSEMILVAGLASSHCVRETVSDLLRTDPAFADKLYILNDCTAPVVVPGHDFTEETEVVFEHFEQAGVRLIRSDEFHGLVKPV